MREVQLAGERERKGERDRASGREKDTERVREREDETDKGRAKRLWSEQYREDKWDEPTVGTTVPFTEVAWLWNYACKIKKKNEK